MRFYIVGCQRSGTNLARLILDSHPHIWTFSENTSYTLLEDNIEDELAKRKSIEIYYKDRDNVPEFVDKNAKWFGYAVPGWTELAVEYECVRDKLSDGKFIFMLRGPLQVVASMFRLNNFEQAIGNMKLWLTDSARTLRDYQEELGDCTNDKYCQAKWLTIYWKYKTRAYLRFPKDRTIGVQYESLVENPSFIIKQIMDFLNLEWHDDLMLHDKKKHYESNHGWTIGNTRIDRPVDRESLIRWKNILDEGQIEIVKKYSQDLLTELGMNRNE